MGKKHKNKQPQPLKTTDACRIAIASYEKEDYNGALEAIKNCKSVHRNTVFYHHAEALLHYKLSMKSENAETISYHKNEAAISVRRAADLCRNSTILAPFCVSMLYLLACSNRHHHDYDKVIQECERALAIKDPEEPDIESFIFKELSKEMETEKINQELIDMIKQCRNKERWVPLDPKKSDYPVSKTGVSATAEDEKQQKREVSDGNIVQQTLEKHEKGVSTFNSNHYGDVNDTRLQDGVGNVPLILDSVENKMGTVPSDVKDETTLQSDVNKNKKTENRKRDEAFKTNSGSENSQLNQQGTEESPGFLSYLLHVAAICFQHLKLNFDFSDSPNPDTDTSVSANESALEVNALGTGLKNENLDCFLNVIIQSLWHLREFQQEFTNRFEAHHKHLLNSCVVCALKGIFDALGKRKIVAPTSLKTALIDRYPDKRETWEGQMNDPSEFLPVILESLHKLLISDSKLEEEASVDCFVIDCFVHRIFGMDHHESINCVKCNVESIHLMHSSFRISVLADSIREKKINDGEKSSDELLKLEMNISLRCQGCGQANDVYRTLRCLPDVFTIDIKWLKPDETSENISKFLSALSTDLDLSVLFEECPPDNKYFLVSLVCFSGVREHYICFIYNHNIKKYVKFDDELVEAIGSWKEVVEFCVRDRWQPTIMFSHQKSRMQSGNWQSWLDTCKERSASGLDLRA